MPTMFDPFDPIGQLPSTHENGSFIEAETGAAEPPRDLLDEPPIRPLTWPLKAVLCLGVGILITRLVTLQLIQGPSNRVQAEGNRIRAVPIEPPRGLILDRQGRSLATNQSDFSLEITPADLPRTAAERAEIYAIVAPLAKLSVDELKQKVEETGIFSLQPIELISNVSQPDSLALTLKTRDLSGVTVAQHAVRHYETTGALSHILGYAGLITKEELNDHPSYLLTSRIGKTGVEESHDVELRGEPGLQSNEVDAEGYLQRTLETTPPIPGKNLVLGIDSTLQTVATNALKAMIDEKKVTSGVVVGIDPRDGTVRLMVSLPDYDNNLFSHSISTDDYARLLNDPNHPLTNRAIAGLYPPGSSIKPVVATAGLADGVITKDTSIDAPAEIKVGDFVFPDWKRHGIVNVERAIAVSSNVFFYAVGGGWDKISGLGIDRLDRHFGLFGLGQLTGIDLPGEQAGLVPTPDWKKKQTKEPWYIGDTYHLSIGQGDLLVTPMQLVQTVAAIANGGTRWEPRLVEATVDPATNVRNPTKPVSIAEHIEPSSAIDVVRKGMRETVLDGSGRALNDLPIPIAGKTGTAEFGNDEKTHAWFASFAPYENPELALIVLVEGGGAGNETAVPVARTIYQWIVDHGFSGDK